MKHKNIVFASVLLCVAGCTSLDLQQQTRDTDTVAAVFTKTAAYVHSQDFVGFDGPLTNDFSAKDLRILRNHRSSLESMIHGALGVQDSVWGAKLAGHFGINKVLPSLRHHFLIPRHCYGWEGPDYSEMESYLTDDQFVYSIAYLEAIETLAGKPVSEAIVLAPHEIEAIRKYQRLPKSEYFHWSLWMQRKLEMKERPNQRMGHDRQ